MSPELKNLLISDILVRFCEQIPYAFVVVWCTQTIVPAVTKFQFGILTTIEMAVAVLIYIPVARFADKSGKKPFVIMTFVFFAAFPLALYFCRTFWLLAAAFVLRGLKEFGEPTRKALIVDLSPEEGGASMFGAYYLARDSVVAVAAFGGSLLWMISPEVNFFTAFAFGVVGTVWFARRGHDFSAPAAGTHQVSTTDCTD
jgi:MFS family permease